jgi:hypothetical protein
MEIERTQRARAALERTLERLARGGARVATVLLLLAIVAEAIWALRLAAELGPGRGLLGAFFRTALALAAAIVIVRLALLPVLRAIHAAILEHGVLESVRITRGPEPLSARFARPGAGALGVVEGLLGRALPTRVVSYRAPASRFDDAGFLYSDQQLVTDGAQEGFALVDPRRPGRRWLWRE